MPTINQTTHVFDWANAQEGRLGGYLAKLFMDFLHSILTPLHTCRFSGSWIAKGLTT